MLKEEFNKGDLVDYIQKKAGFKTKAEAARCVDNVFPSITSAFREGVQKITIPGFGTFQSKHREERNGHNPQTGEPMKIKAYNQPTFRAGTVFKEAVNSDSNVKKKG